MAGHTFNPGIEIGSLKIGPGKPATSPKVYPSIEAIVHAVIPKKFVDHTHSDAVVALTNNANGNDLVVDTYGKRMIVIPYVMPGFVLAKAVHAAIQEAGDLDANGIDGMILMNHGIFTWADDARTAYELMIEHVTLAEKAIKKASSGRVLTKAKPEENLSGLATIRKKVSESSRTFLNRINPGSVYST